MKTLYEVWFYDKNGSGLAYQGVDKKKAEEMKKCVEEDIGEPPYFVKGAEIITHEGFSN